VTIVLAIVSKVELGHSLLLRFALKAVH